MLCYSFESSGGVASQAEVAYAPCSRCAQSSRHRTRLSASHWRSATGILSINPMNTRIGLPIYSLLSEIPTPQASFGKVSTVRVKSRGFISFHELEFLGFLLGFPVTATPLYWPIPFWNVSPHQESCLFERLLGYLPKFRELAFHSQCHLSNVLGGNMNRAV